MTASLFGGGDFEGRVHLTCDDCGKQHTIRAYGITKTRAHAAHRGWQRTGEPGQRRDWCPNCTPPDLFDLEVKK